MTFPGLVVEDLSLRIDTFRLRKLDFTLSAGEILVILGPNGSGKSVTLETISGFHRPDAGRILIDGRDVTYLPPEQRHVGFLVQNFGLFPHLTVSENIAIGLRARRRPPANKAALPCDNVTELLRYFGITQLAQRAPQELSLGEKQRVALARALATHPDLFLFDEPFSALDARTRDQLRDELHTFLRCISIPAIFVTHDHTDAMMLADKLLLLRDGEVVQSGSAAEIFRTPANAFVAEFIGVENILAASVANAVDGFLTVAVGEQARLTVARGADYGSMRDVHLCIKAEDVNLYPAEYAHPTLSYNVNRFQARIVGIRTLGALCRVQVDCGFLLYAYCLARQAKDMKFGPGAPILVEIAAEAIHVISNEPGEQTD
jgi:molybdate/tungstate transport system ATP-binding protein